MPHVLQASAPRWPSTSTAARVGNVGTATLSARAPPWPNTRGCAQASGPRSVENHEDLQPEHAPHPARRDPQWGEALCVWGPRKGLCAERRLTLHLGRTPGRSPTSATSAARPTSRCPTSLSTTRCTRGSSPICVVCAAKPSAAAHTSCSAGASMRAPGPAYAS